MIAFVQSEAQLQELEEVDALVRERQRTFKKRPLGNPGAVVAAHNKESRPRKIPEHIDPVAVEWTDVRKNPPFVIGEKVRFRYEERSNLPFIFSHALFLLGGQQALTISSDEPYKLFWPIQNGQLNHQEYSSPAILRSDLETIWATAVEEQLKIQRKDIQVGFPRDIINLDLVCSFPNPRPFFFFFFLVYFFQDYFAVLIVPDAFVHRDVKAMVEVLLKDLGFKSVIIHQASVAAVLGAGLTSACVVDVGSQKISVACVDDGLSLPRSRQMQCIGGDDITILWHNLLKESSFPFADCDLTLPCDVENINRMKEQMCTCDEVFLLLSPSRQKRGGNRR